MKKTQSDTRKRRTNLPNYLAAGSTAARALYSSTAYAPFGEQYAAFGTADPAFTGENADTASSLYDFTYREQSPSQGRWISPDPAGISAVSPSNPQTWNRYAYVANNPLSYVDPFGLYWQVYCVDTGGGDPSCGLDWIPDATTVPRPGNSSGGGGGDGNAANNGRNCTVGGASKLQYAGATAQVAAMTGEFFSGLGPGNLTFAPNSSTSQVMAQSGPVQEVLNEYYMTGAPNGLYSFGVPGLVSAGGNPVAQFVGSFRWSITPTDGGINLSLTNTTSFRSLTYDAGPQWQRGSWPTPMGNTHQAFNITATCQ